MGQEFRVAKDEFELSLELSIGGCYANSGNKDLEREKGRPHEDINREIPRSDFCGGENQNDKCEFPDVQRKREIQALKRREARMKREVKKSRGPNGVARAEERESREREGTPVPVPEESAAKRERTGAEKVNTSLFGENKVCGTQQQMQAQFLLPVGNGLACPWVVPFWGSNYVVAGEGDGQSSGENVAAAAAAPCSSVVSHHGSTCTSNKGGSSSDSGSQSSSIEKQHGSSKLQHLELDRINNTTTTTSDNAAASTPPTTTTVVNTSPTPASQLHMPCVSTTGTKTITGFLYKYTKSEVSIMCVCHGSFFSPAQFVEHAGGVNVTNPLRHITVVPSLVK